MRDDNKKPRPDLEKAVIGASRSDFWEGARYEWYMWDCEEGSGECVCGQKGLRYLYTIRNKCTQRLLYPIGSVCIDYFGDEKLSTQRKYMDKDEKEFKPPGKPVPKAFGLKYIEIYHQKRWYLEWLIKNWRPSAYAKTAKRNAAFADLIKWYNIRSPILSQKH